MTAKSDYDDLKTDIMALRDAVLTLAKKNKVSSYYTDLLDAIEAKPG